MLSAACGSSRQDKGHRAKAGPVLCTVESCFLTTLCPQKAFLNKQTKNNYSTVKRMYRIKLGETVKAKYYVNYAETKEQKWGQGSREQGKEK